MSHSFASTVKLPCPNGHEFDADCWRVIDVDERPDLVARILDGTLTSPPCAVCGLRDAILVEPLLLYLPGKPRPLLFATFTPDDPQLSHMVSGYAHYLMQQLGPAWSDQWVAAGVPVITFNKLPDYLAATLEEDAVPTSAEGLGALAGNAAVQYESYQETEDPPALDAAIDMLERALSSPVFASADADVRSGVFGLAVETHRVRYGATSGEGDFERASALIEQGLASPDINPVAMLDSKGLLLHDRYRRTGDRHCLVRAAEAAQAALHHVSDTELPIVQFNRGTILRDLFNETGDVATIDEAIAAFRAAAASVPTGTMIAARVRNRLGDALDKRHQKGGRPEDADEAIACFTQVIDAEEADREDRIAARNGRGAVLLDRFLRGNRIEDLRASVVDLTEAVDEEPRSAQMLTTLLIDLANGLRALYDVEGNPQYLERAIQTLERSLEVSRANRLDANVTLSNLGVLLRLRYTETGRLSDLGDAIDFLQLAVDATPDGSQHEATRKQILGALLGSRFERTADPEDLDRAMTLLESATQAAIVPDTSRASLLLNSAYLLTMSGKSAAIDRAIELLTEAADLPLTGGQELASITNMLGTSLASRYSRTKDIDDLRRAIAVLRRAVDMSWSDSRFAAAATGSLAEAVSLLARRESNPAALDEAAALFSKALASPSTPPAQVVQHGSTLGRLEFLRQRWTAAADAFARVLEARETLLALHITRPEKETWLRDVQGVVPAAVYALAKIGALDRAVLAAETGAAVLISEALDTTGTALDRLRAIGRADLADTFQSASDQWRAASKLPLQPAQHVDDEAMIRRMQDARDGMGRALAAVRQIPGLERFQMSATIDDVHRAADAFGGPIVYIAPTRAGTVALVVFKGQVRPVWMEFTDARLLDLLGRRDGHGAFSGYLPAQDSSRDALDESLRSLLPALGSELVGPIAAVLSEFGSRDVALVLNGQLALLPVGASALPHGTLSDQFNVHVVPNARTLDAALMSTRRSSAELDLLAIGNTPTAEPELPAAEMEVIVIGRTFPNGVVMSRAEVAPAVFLNLMPKTKYLHLACHGVSRPDQVLASGLALGGDRWLLVQDLLYRGVAPVSSRLVMMTACQSAMPDFARLPDEMIGLPTAFLALGVPCVVGTLWPVADLSTALLAIRFYRFHRRSSMSPAAAVSRAQRWLRSITARRLERYFRKERRGGAGQYVIPYETASDAWRRFAAMDPETRPFESPVYWAAFTCYGA